MSDRKRALLAAGLVVLAALCLRRGLAVRGQGLAPVPVAAPLIVTLATQDPGINPTTHRPNPGPYTLTATPKGGKAPYTWGFCIVSSVAGGVSVERWNVRDASTPPQVRTFELILATK